MFWQRIFDLIMGNAVLARDENHGRRRRAGDIDRIMPGTTDDLLVGKSSAGRRCANQRDQLRIKRLGLEIDHRIDRNRDRSGRQFGDRRAQRRIHAQQSSIIRMAKIDAELDPARDDVARIGENVQIPHCPAAVGLFAHRNRADSLNQFGRR